jgi:D-alanyl-D-alanine endopeptidase (penicillin-binding protein 7)
MIKKILLALTCVIAISANSTSKLTAKSWLIADENGKVLQSDNAGELRSIASISKLMTVMVVLDAQQDLTEYIKPYTRRELIQLALIKSDNTAAQTLCNNYPGGRDSCVSAMNQKAQLLGMPETKFIEPTGLSVMNISTASELVKLVSASADYPEIVEASHTAQGKIKTKKSWYIFNNTNPAVGKYNFIVSKTGYIRASGGCIVIMLDTALGRRIIVLLGSQNTRTRIPEAELLSKLF